MKQETTKQETTLGKLSEGQIFTFGGVSFTLVENQNIDEDRLLPCYITGTKCVVMIMNHALIRYD